MTHFDAHVCNTVHRAAFRKSPLGLAYAAAMMVLGSLSAGHAQAQRGDALTIDANGNVGIGTPSPADKLSVHGGSVTAQGTSNWANGFYAKSATNAATLRVAPAGQQGVTSEFGFVGTDSNIPFIIRSNSQPVATFLTNGNVGVGTINPGGNRLQVSGGPGRFDGNLAVLGRVGIGTASPNAQLDVRSVLINGVAGQNYFKDAERSDGTGLRVGAAWGMYGIYAENGAAVVGGASGVNLQNGQVVLLTNGNVGVGTAQPRVPMEVSGSKNLSLTDSPDGFCNNGGFNNCSGYRLGTNNGGNFPLSIFAWNWVGAQGFVANSDRRIKDIVGRTEPAKDLELVKKLHVTEYRSVNKMAEGSSLRRGFIAQEVKALLPQAVALRTDAIPDIYSKAAGFTFEAAHKTLAVTLPKTHALANGDIVQIHTEDGPRNVPVVAVAAPDSFVVSGLDTEPKQVFVYGRQVDDLHALHYDQIFATGIGAIQQLDKIVEAKDARIAALEAEVAALRQQAAANAAASAAWEARLAALEKLEQRHARAIALEQRLARTAPLTQQPPN